MTQNNKNVFQLKRLLVILAVILNVNILCAQIPLHNLQIQFPSLYTDFLKQNNSWRWTAGFDISGREADRWQWHAREQYTSDLLIPTKGLKQWKDEHRLTADFSLPTNTGRYGLYVNSWLQSDEHAARDNIFGNHAIGIYSDFGSMYQWSIMPYVGYQQQRVRAKIDWGWDVGIRGELRNYKLGDYNTRLLAEYNYDFYEQIKNYENRFNVGVSRQFTPYTSDSLTFRFSESSKDNYSIDYKNINKIQLNRKELQNKLFYLLSSRDIITLVTQFQSRSLSQFSARNVLYFENQLRFMHIDNKLNYGFSLRTNDETQDNEGTLTDSETRETAIGLQLGYRLGTNDEVNLDVSYIKFQYDTPDEDNKDDRDEQRFVISGQYRHRFSQYLIMDCLAYVYLFHQIYIFKERSANNNWNRVIKLNPRVAYRVPGFSNTLSTEVLANYTVYDFENDILGTRSIVFRKYVFSDSLSASLLPWIKAGAFVRLELEDKGTFLKQDFAQQVVQSYNSQLYNIYLLHTDILNFQFSIGYTHYSRQEYRHISVRYVARSKTDKGPYLQLNYRGSQHILLSANANFNKSEDSYVGITSYVTGTIRLRYLL